MTDAARRPRPEPRVRSPESRHSLPYRHTLTDSVPELSHTVYQLSFGAR